jgi:Protein of unknown function (DUF2917)
MHHIYHSLFSAIAAHEVANTQAADSRAAAPTAVAQRSAPCGSFTLLGGHATALKPKAAAVLRIKQGTAWVTLPSQPGDHFLQAGDSLRIEAGDSVVMEAWHMPGSLTPVTESLYFDWDPMPMHISAPHRAAGRGLDWSALTVPAPRLSYCAAVLQPLADLRSALGLGVRAAVRLVKGMAHWGVASALYYAAALLHGHLPQSRAR